MAVEASRHLVRGKVTTSVFIGDQVLQQESVPSKLLHTPPHSNPTKRTPDSHGLITNSGMQLSAVISFLAAAVVAVRAESFTSEDQAIWIDRHNYFRTTGLPWSAGDMRRIGWSSDLATTAASTAAKCSAATAAGVNAYQSTSTNSSSIIDEAIQQWVVETSMTTLKTLAQPGASGVDVGTGTYNSYSQVLWDSTTSVGCATASCSGGDLVVCQYSPAGNDGSSPWYVHADTASDCPSGTTASQGLCIVDGDAANNQIAAIPAGKLTYEVYPAYVANMQTLLIEAARAIASGSDNSTGSATQSTPTATTAAPTTAPTATTAPTSETSSSSSKEDSAAKKTSSSKKTTTSSSSSSSSDSAATKTSTTTAPPTSESSSDSSTKQSSKTTTDSSDTKQSSQTSTSDESAPGTVKASSDSGSTFTNQAPTATESPAQQTSSSTNTASSPSTANTESTTASTTTSSGAAATSINNQSATGSSGGLSAAGMAGMIVLAIVGIAAFGVVMSYKRNQQRQREIMRDGGIRII